LLLQQQLLQEDELQYKVVGELQGNMCLEWLQGKLPVAAGGKAMLPAFL
jgi:hypothetical protein